MLKNEQSAGTKAEQSTGVETRVTSPHNNGNTRVGRSCYALRFTVHCFKIVSRRL